MTGFDITAPTAHRWGLIDRIYDSSRELETGINFLAERISKNAPAAVRAQKRLIRFWEENDLVSGVDAGVDAFAAAYADGGVEPKQYISKFRARKVRQKEVKDIQEKIWTDYKTTKFMQEKVWSDHPEAPDEPVEDFPHASKSAHETVPNPRSIDEDAPSPNNPSRKPWKPWKPER
jgi:hypothetical protein